VKISEGLAEVRKLIGQLARQNLPTTPDTATFSSILSECGKNSKKQAPSNVDNSGTLTLKDYRSQALPVRVARSIDRYGSNRQVGVSSPSSITDVPENIKQIIDAAADKYNLPAKLIQAVVKVESNFNPRAVSSEGARGLMQLMPATARELGVRNSFDVRENIEAGSRYLKDMMDRFDGKIELALAAYNAGPGAVSKHNGIPPYRETRQYVKKVMAYC
jgi:soluble lytic murein transglycosylase-like protein